MQTLLMPKVENCDASHCAYNIDRYCHTMAINISGSVPSCDTFADGPQKGGIEFILAGVGSCKKSDCVLNRDLECTAETVHITTMDSQAVCATYQPNQYETG